MRERENIVERLLREGVITQHEAHILLRVQPAQHGWIHTAPVTDWPDQQYKVTV